MHVPDGTITGNFLIIYAIIAIVLLAYVFYNSRGKQLSEKNIPLIALFVVATVIVQFIELPIIPFACIHLSLIAIIALYDVKTSMIVYMFVTIIQAFLGEGGVSTLGINLLNLAIIAPLLAYGIYQVLHKINRDVALFAAGFGAVAVLGLIVAVEYAIAGTLTITAGISTIVPVEIFVGILEGIATVFVMRLLSKIKPELVPVMNDN
ncbi:energy-coupling factor ABC transporter permease [Methanosphaera sp.]